MLDDCERVWRWRVSARRSAVIEGSGAKVCICTMRWGVSAKDPNKRHRRETLARSVARAGMGWQRRWSPVGKQLPYEYQYWAGFDSQHSKTLYRL